MRKKAEIDAFPLEVTLGLEPPASLSSDDFTLKEGPEVQRLHSGLIARLCGFFCAHFFQKMINIFSTGQAHTVYFLRGVDASAAC